MFDTCVAEEEMLLYVCGSDEHGVAITIKAKKENKNSSGNRGSIPRDDEGKFLANSESVSIIILALLQRFTMRLHKNFSRICMIRESF